MITNAIEIRQWNKERIRDAVQKHETCTKADISHETGLSMATCSTALNEMLESNEILKVDQIGAGIGSPSDLFAYNRDYLHVLCICIYNKDDSNMIELAVADALGQSIRTKNFSCDNLSSASIEALASEYIAEDPLIRTVGIGIPGVVVDGVIEFCDIKPLEKVNFVQLLGEQFHVDVIVKNDMNIITYYLYRLQQPRGDFAAIYYPDVGSAGYVGSGFIVGGHALHGASMLAGEISHVAEAFGTPLDEQRRILGDRAAFRKFAAQMLATVCCTINPSDVVIMGNHITEEDVSAIRTHCASFISERHLPDIQFSNEIYENYTKGLIRQTLDSTLFPFIV